MHRRDALVAGLLAACLVILLVPLASMGVDPHHDGVMLKPALDVLSGQVLFRDTFTQYGALTTYLQVLALWIQPSLLSLRLLTLVAYALTLFFLYAGWRLILPRSLTVFACGLFVLFIPVYEKDWLGQYWMLLPWSSVYAMMFQSLGLYALFRVIRGEQPLRWGLILGVACACVFWCRQPVGLLMTGCLVLVGLALHWTGWTPAGPSKRSILISVLVGFAAVNLVLFGSIALSGALPEWWYQNFIWPGKWAQGGVYVNLRAFITVFVHPVAAGWLLVLLLAAAGPHLVKRFRPGLSSRSIWGSYLCLGLVLVWQHERVLKWLALRDGGWTALFPLLILLQAIISLTLAFRARGAAKTDEYYCVAALAALSLASTLQYYPMPDSWHVLWSLGPVFGLVVFVLWRWLGWPAPVVAVVMTVVFLPSVYVKARSAAEFLSRPMVTLAEPAALRGMQVPPEKARSLEIISALLQRILQQQPEIPSALIGNDALYLCFTPQRANPSPFFVTWPGLAENEDNLRRWGYIQRVRPLMFLHKAHWASVNDFYRRARYVPLLYLPEEALEIAVPQELADAMGLKVYGGDPGSGPAQETPKP